MTHISSELSIPDFTPLENNFSNLMEVLTEIKKFLLNANSYIDCKYKNVILAQVEIGNQTIVYETIQAYLHKIYKLSEIKKDERAGHIISTLLKDYPKALTSSDRLKIVASDENYMLHLKNCAEIEEVRRIASGVCEAINRKSYGLNNIVKMYTESDPNAIILKDL